MNIVTAAILGIVEGLTEFLPVSSTFHLIFASKFLAIAQSDFQTFFEVFIQAGAILAVIFVYYQYILKHKDYAKTVLISFIPTAIVGFVLHKMIKTVFFNSDLLMIGAFMIIGLVFILVEYFIRKGHVKLTKSIQGITINQAVIIGLAQSMAVLPGVSRAGAVIVIMMLLGFKRDEAALYSFLLAVPTILAASGFDLLKTDFSVINQGQNIFYLIVGFIFAFATALLVIKWFIRFIQKNSLVPFGAYRVIASVLLFFTK